MKLLALLTEPGEVVTAERISRYLVSNGGQVPLLMGLDGEFSDDDLRAQDLCSSVLLQVCKVLIVAVGHVVFGL